MVVGLLVISKNTRNTSSNATEVFLFVYNFLLFFVFKDLFAQ